MQKIKIGLLFFALAISKLVPAQQDNTILLYIASYKEFAIKEMLRTGVPASITLAQGIHETEAGKSELVKKSNNHFGIKCKSSWSGPSVRHDDDARAECFRKYDNAEDSYRDHSDFLRNSPRYSFLFNLDPENYEDWAFGLKKAGYATNPKYPQLLIKLIEDYNLNDYTLIALGKKKDDTKDIAINQRASSGDYAIPASVKQTGEETAAKLKAEDYPAGEFKINQTKVVVINKGTSYLTIANQYNISLARLFEFNDMQDGQIAETDQLIYLQRKRKTGNNEFHIVQPGETLFDIAQMEAIRLENLLSYNMLTPEQQPAIGEKLYLHTKAPATPRLILKADYNLYGSRPVTTNQ